MRWFFVALVSLFAAAAPAHADDVASFYSGKQIRFIVGSAPGGTYDLLARIVARHIGAHIPGNPSIIVQNQPTAGGIVMTNELYALGPKDGTVIGVPLNGIPAAPLLQPKAARFRVGEIDLARLHPQRAVRGLCLAHRAGAKPRRCADHAARRRRHHAGHHDERFSAC